jgi:hypothetical protein
MIPLFMPLSFRVAAVPLLEPEDGWFRLGSWFEPLLPRLLVTHHDAFVHCLSPLLSFPFLESWLVAVSKFGLTSRLLVTEYDAFIHCLSPLFKSFCLFSEN